MNGFFSKKVIKSELRPDGRTYSCHSCGLYRGAYSPKMTPYGEFGKRIMNIGEFPTALDDENNTPFSDKNGRLIKRTYKKLGIDLVEDCINLNAIRCHPMKKGATRIPTDYEIDCCRRFVLEAIKRYKPDVIVVFGLQALQSLIGHRSFKAVGKMAKWRGHAIPDQDLKAWICPVFSPMHVLPSKNKAMAKVWEEDLQNAISMLDVPFREHKEPKIHYIKDLEVLRTIPEGSTIVIDYETTGLKPHAHGHKIICISVAVDINTVYVFMVPEDRKKLAPFIWLMKNWSIKKVAQNMKFEHSWTKNIFGIKILGWIWDTMLATHVLDNRSSITGLKFQTYIKFGIVDYSSDVDSYLKSVDEQDGNGLNRIEELVSKPVGVKDLLKYCAYDSIYEYRLYELQQEQFKKSQFQLEEAYNLLHEGILSLFEVEQHGIHIDLDYLYDQIEDMDNEVVQMVEDFKETAFYKEWAKSSATPVNIFSGDQLGTFLYKIKGIKPKKETKSGKGSTDEEALGQLNIPELSVFGDIKKHKKLKTTYLEGFLREQVNGVLHAFFHLHLAVTYRGSSDKPNVQNIPKRNALAMKLVRQSIIPSPGNQLMELDYKQLEVRIAACYHKDPTMLEFLETGHDFHLDYAKEIFRIDDFDFKKHSTLRSAAKNGFVFPEFYGDYYKNCAESLSVQWCELTKGAWKPGQGIMIGDEHISDHMIRQGLTSYSKFENHLQKMEKHLWEVRFPVYAAWKETWWKAYQENGYMKAKTGFVFQGVMGRNDVINYPVQGAAFHVLLWSLTEGNKAMKRGGYKTRFIGQIHDAIVIDLCPPERDEVVTIMKRIMCEDVREHWKWINIPLEIDAELCPIDESWATKEGYDIRAL